MDEKKFAKFASELAFVHGMLSCALFLTNRQRWIEAIKGCDKQQLESYRDFIKSMMDDFSERSFIADTYDHGTMSIVRLYDLLADMNDELLVIPLEPSERH